ncbi:MAG: T9SS type A sorting domain-containing protein [Bacteroidetes bacterium]|nr:T9SS type A sorting domain-containing protein [Bacteroidota bacterium]
MKKFVLFFVLLQAAVFSQPANHVVISEVAPYGGASTAFNTGEFVELYNPTSADITFGDNVTLVSGNVPAGSNAAEWSVSLAGKTIKAYGFFLIGDGGVTPTPDIAFPASKNLANSGARSAVQIRDGAVVIDALAWDASTSLSGEGTKFTPSNTTSNGKSFERKSGPLATGPDTLGNAWDSNNNAADFFENAKAAANPQNSSSKIEINNYVIGPVSAGEASLSPSLWKYNVPTAFTVVVTSPKDSVKGIRIVKPSVFSWNADDISVLPNTIVKTKSGDTTTFTSFTLKGTDSVVITIPAVTASDTTDELSLNIQTSSDGDIFSGISAQPTMLVYGSPKTIAEIKVKEPNGVHSLLSKWAVTKGIVTVANEFGGPSYIQDANAGMAFYDSSVTNYIERGDEIVILGKVAPFGGLFEFAPCILLEKLSEGNSFDTLVVTTAQLAAQSETAVEPYEARLVRVKGITSVTTTAGVPITAWTVTGSGTNYNMTDASGKIQVRISSKVNFANTPTPVGKFDVVGVVGEFISSNTPIYQVLPRSIDDIIPEGNGPRITSSAPYESGISATSVTFMWTTDVPGNSTVNYGTTSAYGNSKTDTNKTLNHKIVLTGLMPATVYHIQLSSTNEGGTTVTSDYITSTSSATSTGVMNVYFNQTVNTALAKGETAQTVNIANKLIARINSAQYSIDVALYSLSGTVGANIATALIQAKGRGVKVRVIGEKDNQGTAPWTTLKNNGVTVIDDGFDATNAGAGLMHNKFVVFDNRDASSDTDDWVWAGSWNATDPGNNNDAQNVIEIQDKALANAYTLEFEEMWGSTTDTPNASASRFGARKFDNTPHYFVINGTPVSLFFSPSDRTNAQLLNTISKAKSSVNFALLTFTRNDIANLLIAEHKNGIKVRGVVDNRTDSGAEYDTLLASGIDIFLKKNVAGLLHHKYAIIDADVNDSMQFVITGSHNWSSSAENSNNENTLILRSTRLANLYLQEFSQRYTDAGGKDALLSVEKIQSLTPSVFSLSQNYPNPFNPTTTITYNVAQSGIVSLKVYNLLGQEVGTLVNTEQSSGVYRVQFSAEAFGLSSGVYFYELRAGNFVSIKKMILMK